MREFNGFATLHKRSRGDVNENDTENQRKYLFK